MAMMTQLGNGSRVAQLELALNKNLNKNDSKGNVQRGNRVHLT
jgi:hypothetical protein